MIPEPKVTLFKLIEIRNVKTKKTCKVNEAQAAVLLQSTRFEAVGTYVPNEAEKIKVQTTKLIPPTQIITETPKRIIIQKPE